MRALVLSGGGAKGAFTAGVARYLLRDQNMDFDLAVGTSAGSLVGGPALLGDYNYLSNIYTGVENKDIFKNSLLGRILNFLNIVNAPIDADADPLHNLVKDYYLNDGRLEDLIDSGKEFVVTAVNVRTEKLHFISTKEVADGKIKPETFVNAIIASASEPVFTKPIRVFENETNSEFKNDLFYDGGVKEFIPLEHAVILGGTDIWAISTNPLVNEETAWGGNTSPDDVNILDAVAWTVGGLLNEVARGDRFRADLYVRWDKAKNTIIQRAKDAGLNEAQAEQLVDLPDDESPTLGISLPLLRIIRPTELMGPSLEFDPAVMAGYLDTGILIAEEFFKNGAPLYKDDPTLRPWIRSEWSGGEYT